MGLLRRGKSSPELADAYQELRGQALGLRSASLGAEVDAARPSAALMEMGSRKGVASLVAVADGSVSLYLSNGGGVIGAGEDKELAALGGELMAALEGEADLLEQVESAALPEPGCVRFQLVSDSGIRSAEGREKDLRKRSAPLSAPYLAGQNLLTAIRLKSSESR